MRQLLSDAGKDGRAVGAFSVSCLESIQGVILAAEETNTPVILQVAEVRLPYSPLALIGPAMLGAARQASVPVAVHLDHGMTINCIKAALDIGFTSVMIDGSTLSLDENIALTKQVVDIARPYNAAVEAEVGRVGRTESGEDAPPLCAEPTDALRFIRETEVDALAVAIGNAHGIYEGTPKLRFYVLEKIREESALPLVLHGGTGICDADYRRCISLGMHKINIATAIFQALKNAAQGAGDYFAMSGRMTEAARAVARRHMDVFSNSSPFILA